MSSEELKINTKPQLAMKGVKVLIPMLNPTLSIIRNIS
jgi:hypothetical protein